MAKEMRTLLIEGDLVRLQRTIVEREVRTGDLIAEIARLQPLHTGPLPAGCIWYARQVGARNRTISIFVVRRAGGVQVVRFSERHAPDDATVERLELSWPATLWFVRCEGEAVQDVHLTAAAAPLVDRDTPLRRLPMPNQYDGGDGSVCLGNLTVEGDRPLARRVEELIEQVLSSLWNIDLMPVFSDTGVSGLLDWADRSAADPEFHTRLTLPAHRHATVGAMLDHLLGGSP